jgi:hypothetical protein
LRPQLIVNINARDDGLTDAALSPDTKAFLHTVAKSYNLPLRILTETGDTHRTGTDAAWATPRSDEDIVLPASDEKGCSNFEVPLVSDGEFFNILLNNVIKLEGLQATQERTMSSEIVALGNDIARLSKPTHIAKNDLEKWRAIFELYLEAAVFFSTREEDVGYRDNGRAARQLTWFRAEMERLNHAQGFRLHQSRVALDRFLRLNVDLLRNLHFQEINRLAVTKILKSMSHVPMQIRCIHFIAQRYIILTMKRRIRQEDVLHHSQVVPRHCASREAPRGRSRQGHMCSDIHPTGFCCAPTSRLPMPRLLLHRLQADTSFLPPCLLHPLRGEAAASPREALPALQIRNCAHGLPWFVEPASPAPGCTCID